MSRGLELKPQFSRVLDYIFGGRLALPRLPWATTQCQSSCFRLQRRKLRPVGGPHQKPNPHLTQGLIPRVSLVCNPKICCLRAKFSVVSPLALLIISPACFKAICYCSAPFFFVAFYFIFFSIVQLVGSWFPGSCGAWVPVAEVLSSNPCTNKEPQTQGNINQCEHSLKTSPQH